MDRPGRSAQCICPEARGMLARPGRMSPAIADCSGYLQILQVLTSRWDRRILDRRRHLLASRGIRFRHRWRSGRTHAVDQERISILSGPSLGCAASTHPAVPPSTALAHCCRRVVCRLHTSRTHICRLVGMRLRTRRGARCLWRRRDHCTACFSAAKPYHAVRQAAIDLE